MGAVSEELLLDIGMENLSERKHVLEIVRLKLMEKFYGGICIQGAAAGCWVNPGIKCWLTQVSWAGLLVGWKRWDCVFELTYQQFDTIFRFASDDTKLKTVFEIFNDFIFWNADATNNENKPRNVGASLKCFHSQKTCSVII